MVKREFTEIELAYLRAWGHMGPWHMAFDLGHTQKAIKEVCDRLEIPLGGTLIGYKNQWAKKARGV